MTLRSDVHQSATFNQMSEEEKLRMIREKVLKEKIDEHFKGHAPRFTQFVTVVQVPISLLEDGLT